MYNMVTEQLGYCNKSQQYHILKRQQSVHSSTSDQYSATVTVHETEALFVLCLFPLCSGFFLVIAWDEPKKADPSTKTQLKTGLKFRLNRENMKRRWRAEVETLRWGESGQTNKQTYSQPGGPSQWVRRLSANMPISSWTAISCPDRKWGKSSHCCVKMASRGLQNNRPQSWTAPHSNDWMSLCSCT